MEICNETLQDSGGEHAPRLQTPYAGIGTFVDAFPKGVLTITTAESGLEAHDI